jgi:uncharacterized protein (TIGR03067 family)
MYKCFALIIVCSISASATGSGDDKNQPKTIDINGTWKMVGLIEAGKEIPADRIEKAENGLILKEGKFKDFKDEESGTFKIDSSKSPTAIDFAILQGQEKGKTQLGLIKLEGDVLTMALSKYGSTDRPKGFDGADAHWILTLKRSK